MLLHWVAEHFNNFQIAIVVVILLFAWNTFRSRQQETSFRARESERDDLSRLKQGDDSAHAKLKKHSPASPSPAPLQLPGIALNGKPHEILGVDEQANEAEIMRAYKEKIKMFHPDRIQGQARNQMRFYEEASAKINDAKDAMIAEIRRK